MSDHEDETIIDENAPPKVVPQIITVTNISTKFPYLKKEEYDIWAMKMQNFISSSDLLCWNIVLKGNSAKSMTTDKDGNLKIRSPVTAKEHQQVQREEKARTILLFTLPDEHMGLEYISFDDLYSKLKFLEIDTKGYLSSSSTLLNAAFVSIAGSSQGHLSYQESGNGGHTTTLSVSPGSSSSKGSSKSKCSVVDDVIYSFFANHEIDQHLVYEDLDQMNKEKFEEYDLKHQMAMLSIKQMGHFSRECRAQGGQNSNNYQKYKSKEAGKDGSNSKAMVVVDGSIDWDKRIEEGNTEPRSLEKFGMVAGIEIASDADSEGEVVSADNAIPVGVSVSAGDVAAAVVSPHSETEFALMGLSTEELMTKLDNEIANHAKWNNSGKNLYKLIDSSISVRTKRGLGLDKYIRECELVDHMKAVHPPLTRNYMPPSNIPDTDESHMVYGKKATNSFEIKTNDDSISHSNDSVLFDFSNRSSKPSINDLQTCDSSMECSRPNHSEIDSTGSISSVSAPTSEYRDTIVIDCDRQEDLLVFVVSKLIYLHLIKDCDLHEQRFAKRNAKGKGIMRRRPTGKPVNPNRPKPVSAGQQNPVSASQQNPVSAGPPNLVSAGQQNSVSAGQPNPVSTGDRILGPRPLNIQPKKPTTVAQALADPDWVEAMQAEMKQFRNQKVWVLVTLPDGKWAIGTKWILKNKRDARGIVYINKARIEAIRLFLAFASSMGFRVYQMYMKSAFLYGKIAEEIYVTQPRGLQVDQRPYGIFIQQEKYVADILKKFDLDNSKLASTPFEPQKIREKNVLDEPISVHLYRSMIGCLMYLTATRPDIMFVVCAAARHQVTSKNSNLLSVKRIFKYLTAYPKLGLWYPRDSPFDLEAFSDSDYACANGDRKSTTGGCQFLGRRLIYWQCKKQTIVATSSCEAEYVAAASCCGQDSRMGEKGFLAGISVKLVRPGGVGFGFRQKWPLGFINKGLVKLQFGSLWFLGLELIRV
nr:hypothetical protein [Tanacetum cinerariifolium]